MFTQSHKQHPKMNGGGGEGNQRATRARPDSASSSPCTLSKAPTPAFHTGFSPLVRKRECCGVKSNPTSQGDLLPPSRQRAAACSGAPRCLHYSCQNPDQASLGVGESSREAPVSTFPWVHPHSFLGWTVLPPDLTLHELGVRIRALGWDRWDVQAEHTVESLAASQGVERRQQGASPGS